MKKRLGLLFVLALCGSMQAYSETPTAANIEYLESKAISKLMHARERVNKYKECLNDATSDDEVEKWAKKVRKAEKKLKKLNDSLNTLELLKAQLLS
jgi:predicted  nucleic acid-binding Zn-ribbon protein